MSNKYLILIPTIIIIIITINYSTTTYLYVQYKISNIPTGKMQGRHQENVGGRNANPTNLQEQITNNVLKHTTANLPSTNSPAEGPNLGFKPTAAMVSRVLS